MRSLRWALIPYDWCPCKIRRFGHRHIVGRPGEDTARRQPSTSQGEGPHKKKQPGRNLILASWSRMYKLLFKPPSLVVSYCSPSWLIQTEAKAVQGNVLLVTYSLTWFQHQVSLDIWKRVIQWYPGSSQKECICMFTGLPGSYSGDSLV